MDKISKTDDEWRSQLTPEQYHVCRQSGTEHAFSGKFYQTKDEGQYHCVCCGALLFASSTKFESGTGWPSFWIAATPNAITSIADSSHGMVRTEVVCSRCDAHLGHSFPDGPPPTGMRYCINSVSLEFRACHPGESRDPFSTN